MGNFNRDRSSRFGGGRGWERRGPAQMHQATCDKCRQSCEVPFRPTNGKPVYCSNCFENNRGSDSRQSNFEDRQMFEAVCDECRNRCQVPFQPSGGKPVYCNNCFGDKKGGDRNKEQSQPQYQEQFLQLNNKLDQILTMLVPKEIQDQQPEVAKKKPSKKK